MTLAVIVTWLCLVLFAAVFFAVLGRAARQEDEDLEHLTHDRPRSTSDGGDGSPSGSVPSRVGSAEALTSPP